MPDTEPAATYSYGTATLRSSATMQATGTVSFTLSPPLTNVLLEIAQASGESPDDLIRMGIAVLKVALKAKEEGKSIGIAKAGEPLQTILDIF